MYVRRIRSAITLRVCQHTSWCSLFLYSFYSIYVFISSFFVFLFSMKIKFHINRMLKIKWKIIIDELNKINEGISFANIQGKRRIGFGYFWWMFIPVVFFIRNWLRLHSFFFYLHFRNIIAKSKLIAHNKKKIVRRFVHMLTSHKLDKLVLRCSCNIFFVL